MNVVCALGISINACMRYAHTKLHKYAALRVWLYDVPSRNRVVVVMVDEQIDGWASKEMDEKGIQDEKQKRKRGTLSWILKSFFSSISFFVVFIYPLLY